MDKFKKKILKWLLIFILVNVILCLLYSLFFMYYVKNYYPRDEKNIKLNSENAYKNLEKNKK